MAVKTVKEGASDREKEDLVRELEIMQRVGSHSNVVTLLGCCTEEGNAEYSDCEPNSLHKRIKMRFKESLYQAANLSVMKKRA